MLARSPFLSNIEGVIDFQVALVIIVEKLQNTDQKREQNETWEL